MNGEANPPEAVAVPVTEMPAETKFSIVELPTTRDNEPVALGACTAVLFPSPRIAYPAVFGPRKIAPFASLTARVPIWTIFWPVEFMKDTILVVSVAGSLKAFVCVNVCIPFSNGTFPLNRASATVPLETLEPFSDVRPEPLPVKL